MRTTLLLLRKELNLALHPTAFIFLGLSAMLLIPSYPYLVVFFYTTLALFFTCLTGRENGDVAYTLLLPVSRRQLVRARMLLAMLMELGQMLCAIPFALLRSALIPEPNAAGLDANVALFGLAFAMLGLFNLLFFRLYYRDVKRVGRAFLWASGAVFLFVALEETCAHVLSLMRDVLDTPDPLHLPAKIAVLASGATLWLLFSGCAYRGAVRDFQRLDV